MPSSVGLNLFSAGLAWRFARLEGVGAERASSCCCCLWRLQRTSPRSLWSKRPPLLVYRVSLSSRAGREGESTESSSSCWWCCFRNGKHIDEELRDALLGLVDKGFVERASVCFEQLVHLIACCWQEEVAVDNGSQADLQRRCGREHLYLLAMF